MNKNEYNGWHNFGTWVVALWLDNEESSQTFWRNRAQELVEHWAETPSANARMTGNEPFTTEEKAVMALEKELQADFKENNPLGDQANVWADLMNAALFEVNWHEVAEHYVNEVDIKEEEKEEGKAVES